MESNVLLGERQQMTTGDAVGSKIRLTCNENAELTFEKGKEYRDATITTVLKDKESGRSVWLVDFGTDVPIAERFVKKAGSSVRHLLLFCAQPTYRLENIFEGYWIPVAPFVIVSEIAQSANGTVSLKSRNLRKLFSQMCYQVPRGIDPYQERWTPAMLLHSTLLETLPLIGSSKARFHELKIQTSEGRTFVGISADDHLASTGTNADVLVELRLSNCTHFANVSAERSELLEQNHAETQYSLTAVGRVAGLWWLGSNRYSVSVADQIIVVDGCSKANGQGLRVDDRIEVSGLLELLEKTPFKQH